MPHVNMHDLRPVTVPGDREKTREKKREKTREKNSGERAGRPVATPIYFVLQLFRSNPANLLKCRPAQPCPSRLLAIRYLFVPFLFPVHSSRPFPRFSTSFSVSFPRKLFPVRFVPRGLERPC